MIDQQSKELLTRSGFIARYFKYCKDNPCQLAYELTEKDFLEAFGSNKYASYDTFRVILSRLNTKNR